MEFGATYDQTSRYNKFAIIKLRPGRPTDVQYTLMRNPFIKSVAPQNVKDLTTIAAQRNNYVIIEKVN
ncbi:MAG: hypothetical protein MRY21_07725 [Simkaniaceae bacterium]|nr:hypothetical protein [Simkaniaceae bacterium]